jgi:hypothetical protein
MLYPSYARLKQEIALLSLLETLDSNRSPFKTVIIECRQFGRLATVLGTKRQWHGIHHRAVIETSAAQLHSFTKRRQDLSLGSFGFSTASALLLGVNVMAIAKGCES